MNIRRFLFQIVLNCVTAVKGNLIIGLQGIQPASQEKRFGDTVISLLGIDNPVFTNTLLILKRTFNNVYNKIYK